MFTLFCTLIVFTHSSLSQTPYVPPNQDQVFWPTEESLKYVTIPQYPPQDILSLYGNYDKFVPKNQVQEVDEPYESNPLFKNLKPQLSQNELEQELMTVFTMYDKNFNKFVTKEEIFSQFSRYFEGQEQPKEYQNMIDSLFKQYDKDGNGLNMDQFLDMIRIERTAFVRESNDNELTEL